MKISIPLILLSFFLWTASVAACGGRDGVQLTESQTIAFEAALKAFRSGPYKLANYFVRIEQGEKSTKVSFLPVRTNAEKETVGSTSSGIGVTFVVDDASMKVQRVIYNR